MCGIILFTFPLKSFFISFFHSEANRAILILNSFLICSGQKKIIIVVYLLYIIIYHALINVIRFVIKKYYIYSENYYSEMISLKNKSQCNLVANMQFLQPSQTACPHQVQATLGKIYRRFDLYKNFCFLIQRLNVCLLYLFK
jgi:hypothetical protein